MIGWEMRSFNEKPLPGNTGRGLNPIPELN
jgi:hypothetical protein